MLIFKPLFTFFERAVPLPCKVTDLISLSWYHCVVKLTKSKLILLRKNTHYKSDMKNCFIDKTV